MTLQTKVETTNLQNFKSVNLQNCETENRRPYKFINLPRDLSSIAQIWVVMIIVVYFDV